MTKTIIMLCCKLVHISESKRCYNVIPSVHYFDEKTKILKDFQTWISVPLNRD